MARPKKTVEPTPIDYMRDALESLQGAKKSIGERDEKLFVLSEGQFNHIQTILISLIGDE